MSSLPYAKLLVNVFNLSKNQAEDIAQLLTESDLETIRVAIAALENKPSGYRLPEIVTRYYGIECDSVSMREIGATLDRPVSPSFVQQLRTKAEFYLNKMVVLQPTAARLYDANFSSYRLELARNRLTPVKLEALKVVALDDSDDEGTTKGTFILDCLSDCVPDDPCPTCRARALLVLHEGLLDETIRLAQEWLSGPSGDWRSTSIKTVDFSVRTVNCLLNENIYTLGQLCAKTESELLRSSNFGRKSLNEVKDFLESLGKQLRPR